MAGNQQVKDEFTQDDVDLFDNSTVFTDILNAITGTSGNFAVQYIVDSGNANLYYYGRAAIATATSSALWQIKRLDYTSGDVKILWADGDESFDNIYDNREALSYS